MGGSKKINDADYKFFQKSLERKFKSDLPMVFTKGTNPILKIVLSMTNERILEEREAIRNETSIMSVHEREIVLWAAGEIDSYAGWSLPEFSVSDWLLIVAILSLICMLCYGLFE